MRSEKQYIELFETCKEQIERNSHPLLNVVRRDACEYLRAKGFPSRKEEQYRYTDVNAAFAPDYGLNVHRVLFPTEPHKMFRCSVPNMGSSVFFMLGDRFVPSAAAEGETRQGAFVGSICDYARRKPGFLDAYYNHIASQTPDSVVALNTMLAQDGLLVYVERGVKVESTLQIVNLGRSEMDLMTNRRVLIVLEEGAEASVLFCDHNIDHHQFLTTQVMETYLAAQSHLSLCSIEETRQGNTLFDNVFVRQMENSRLDCGYFTLRNGLTRRSGCFQLQGEGAEVNVFGGVIGDGKEHIDTNLLIDHAKGNCHSDVLYKYVLDGESCGAFAGKVLVRKDAQKTDSQETNANLCVSPHARMYTQPMLEIYADDVKCNHGSTVGRMDEKALFYMGQRGVPEAEANLLLQEAFLGDAIRRIRIEPLRERLTMMVEQRFRHKMKGCGDCGLCATKKE